MQFGGALNVEGTEGLCWAGVAWHSIAWHGMAWHGMAPCWWSQGAEHPPTPPADVCRCSQGHLSLSLMPVFGK